MPTVNGTYYSQQTPQEVIDLLEKAKLTGQRIRLFTGSLETGEEWFDEYSVTGRVGRSTGTHKVPLLIANSRSLGGGAILTDCIVKLFVNGQKVWQAPNYKQPEIIAKGKQVYTNGRLHADFKSGKQAEKLAAFMRGERMCK